jgi:hypothetical protein
MDFVGNHQVTELLLLNLGAEAAVVRKCAAVDLAYQEMQQHIAKKLFAFDQETMFADLLVEHVLIQMIFVLEDAAQHRDIVGKVLT